MLSLARTSFRFGIRSMWLTMRGFTRLISCADPLTSAATRAVESFIASVSTESTWPRSLFQ
ncbi:hypothetical protein D3C80_1960400 [compost metagenome]